MTAALVFLIFVFICVAVVGFAYIEADQMRDF